MRKRLAYAMSAEEEKALENIVHANASYKAHDNSLKGLYLEGTRTDLLEKIEQWAISDDGDSASFPIYLDSRY